MRIADLVAELAKPPSSGVVFNPWRDEAKDQSVHNTAYVRRVRLRRFLERASVDYLLVGEAPGWRDARLTGVPFTSEEIVLFAEPPKISSKQRLSDADQPFAERTARCVWDTLFAAGIAHRTVLWNAFPWHPHEPGEPFSNRTPTPQERASGHELLREVLAYYTGVRLVAVGAVAGVSLEALGVEHEVVWHPARGREKLFASQLTNLAKR